MLLKCIQNQLHPNDHSHCTLHPITQPDGDGTFATPARLIDESGWFVKNRLNDTIKYSAPSNNFFPTLEEHTFPNYFAGNPGFVSDGFDFPVAPPNGQYYFKAREFGQKKHLGEDWNGINGGNTDLGDPVHSIAHGLVTFAENVCCGWGNVVRVVHKVPNDPNNEYVESVYAHLQNINVKVGDLIKRGQKVGTIGTANGKYSAHLHLEMRSFVSMSLGPGYSDDTFGYLIPTKYIKQNRPAKRKVKQ